ncbi:altered inheritance of mitochondria protein 21 [Apodospora peruviana]|uniref:Altered inheritance of mitochondria protein 21 n=1 Tax=Apodospora peruviana TaxID=516989 RepID=A0AAE0I0N8_9PEZI|nr:altered inheritance of mitochondria protein 21 [Apodospora peruviana]
MSATATQQPPSIPPRPSRSQEKAAAPIPMVPPRPAKSRIERSVSPNHDRFAPSPLNEGLLLSKSARSSRFAGDDGTGHNGDYNDSSKYVDLPSVGEEGMEYAGLAELSSSRSNSPEQTRTVGDDLHLHAPKPSLPAVSAKQRVMAVTRTDSDRAASFGIGRPSSNGDSTPALPSNRSLKKKASTTSQLSHAESHDEDEHGIPEIGTQVPMYPNAGDVQAPSPAPGAMDPPKSKHHSRKSSARGNLPPGSYGLHGHGVVAQDKLEKAYYEKHPDLLKKEHTPHHHDRPYDFSMSKDDLNKIVRDTASRGSGLAVKNYAGTPTDQIGWQAIEESTSRVTSPGPAATEFKSPHKASFTGSDAGRTDEEGEVIHVEDPSRRRSVMFSEGESPNPEEELERPYTAPILADDEVAKDPAPYDHQPAVELQKERRGSEESASRPTSRPASLYKETSFDMRSTPLEDVEEYEPLFTEEEKEKPKKSLSEEEKKAKKEYKRRFPSADIWEDAPSSVHYTAEVSTPEPSEEQAKQNAAAIPTPREGETPAHAFARLQEELAEKEARENGPDGFIPMRNKQKPASAWVQHQPHLVSEVAASRPSMSQRFPSRDVWEDTPESLQLETTVSTPQQENEQSPVDSKSPQDLKPEVPSRPQAKPAEAPEKSSIPGRPKPRQGSGDNNKPAISDRPKPQIPARPVKVGPTSGGLEPADAAAPPRQKPAVPARPTGSKIAALQAGFMNDLNRRLQLGPQAPKKEEPAAEEAPAEEKEKAPLTDARKGRARGPQRRAPAKSASPAPSADAATAEETPKFSFSMTVTVFDVDPEEGVVSVGKTTVGEPKPVEEAKEEPKPVEEAKEEPSESSTSPPEAEEEQPATPTNDKGEEETKGLVSKIKSLVTNMAGETIVEEHIKKNEEKQTVESVEAEKQGGTSA